jgi:hypothetical protein
MGRAGMLFSATGSEGQGEGVMNIGTLLIIILILLLIGAVPTWPHSQSWGYAPSGTLGIILIVVIVLLVLGRI